MSLYALTLSIGLLISLLLSDGLMIIAGGLIVPGYFASILANPLLVLMMLINGMVTYALLIGVSKITLLYGRRQFVMAVLLGLFITLLNHILVIDVLRLGLPVNVVGWVIPGLLALWIYRQGITATLSALTIVTITTALVMELVHFIWV